MIFSRRHLLALALVLTLSPALFAASGGRKQPTRPAKDAPAYKGAIVVDAATGNVLFEDRADNVSPPASMTKLMTFAVLHDAFARGAINLDTPVPIEPEDCETGTRVYLDPRETFSVEELIYAMMIESANDAAHALARITAGSVPAFVERMNAKARDLGMTNTTFRTPHGLPPSSRRIADGDLASPRDFALLCRYLLQRTDVLKYSAVRERPFGPNRAKGPMRMENHNNLLGKVAGVDGLKTGYTASAGYCLSATASRNGRRVIAVIMGSFGPGGQRDYGRARDVKTIELLERGFAALPPAPVTPTISTEPTRSSVPNITPPPAPPARPEEPMLKLSLPKSRS